MHHLTVLRVTAIVFKLFCFSLPLSRKVSLQYEFNSCKDPAGVRNYPTPRIVPWLRESARVSLKPSRRTQPIQGWFRSGSLKPSLRSQPLRCCRGLVLRKTGWGR